MAAGCWRGACSEQGVSINFTSSIHLLRIDCCDLERLPDLKKVVSPEFQGFNSQIQSRVQHDPMNTQQSGKAVRNLKLPLVGVPLLAEFDFMMGKVHLTNDTRLAGP
jgi:hypothetical protein